MNISKDILRINNIDVVTAYIKLLFNARDDGLVLASQAMMARQVGLTLNTYRKYLDILADLSLVSVETIHRKFTVITINKTSDSLIFDRALAHHPLYTEGRSLLAVFVIIAMLASERTLKTCQYKLAKQMGISTPSLRKYLGMLEAMSLVKVDMPSRKNGIVITLPPSDILR